MFARLHTHVDIRCLNSLSLSLSVSETDIIFIVKSAAVWFGTLSGKLNKVSILSETVQPDSAKVLEYISVVHIML